MLVGRGERERERERGREREREVATLVGVFHLMHTCFGGPQSPMLGCTRGLGLESLLAAASPSQKRSKREAWRIPEEGMHSQELVSWYTASPSLGDHALDLNS